MKTSLLSLVFLWLLISVPTFALNECENHAVYGFSSYCKDHASDPYCTVEKLLEYVYDTCFSQYEQAAIVFMQQADQCKKANELLSKKLKTAKRRLAIYKARFGSL